jgi:two-component system chemotaxis response regulator CheB
MSQQADSVHGPALVAIASSAGGIQALRVLLSALPCDLNAVFLIVQHLDPDHRSVLPEILARSTGMRVKHAEHGERVQPGVVYVGPPNSHLLLNVDWTITLAHTELVHFVRPSADLLFESVAAAAGERALAVVLTGTGHDGALGTSAIKKRGGHTIAQDEASSDYFGMPGSAIAEGSVDEVLPLEDIAAAVTAFANGRLAWR